MIDNTLKRFISWKIRNGYGLTTPQHYLEIIDVNLEECKNHLENQEFNKLQNELMDILLLSYECSYTINNEPIENLENNHNMIENDLFIRSEDIRKRFPEIIKKYEGLKNA